MGVELRPLGVKCNIQCPYCYQNPQRDAGNVPNDYSMEKMKAAIEKSGTGSFTLFGGEALLVPEKDLEELWAWGLQKFGRNGIQTNGTLINDEHRRLFKKYRVDVGISMDGPDELNDTRWAGTQENTRESTKKTQLAIERLCLEGTPPGIIVTLSRNNAAPDKLPRMRDWLLYLDALGIRSVRLHILEVEDPEVRSRLALTAEENIAAFLFFASVQSELQRIQIDVFEDMRNLLLAKDENATCVWSSCDPYTTRAVQGVEGNGQTSNCGRTNKDGIDFTKAEREGFERYMALYYTPQQHRGCADCRYFLMCRGQCPGTSVAGDWRNRSEHCNVWMQLFDRVEADLLQRGYEPLSRSPLRKQVEETLIENWAKGKNPSIATCLRQVQVDAIRAMQGELQEQFATKRPGAMSLPMA